jgi:hypothetical protein
VIPTEQGQELANRYQLKFFETSAKLSLRLEEVFNTIANDVLGDPSFLKLFDRKSTNVKGANSNDGHLLMQPLQRSPKRPSSCC